MINKKIAGSFRITQQIGKGSFGSIFQAVHLKSKKEVAIKVENKNNGRNFKYLNYEYEIYRFL